MPYPRGLEDRLEALERKVDQLFASIQNRQPVTTASAGWIIPNNDGDSSLIDSGGHLGASADEPVWTEANGSTYSLKPSPSFSGTSTPQYPTSFTSPATVIGTVPDTAYNALRADAAMLQVCIRSIINNGATTSPALWPSP
jgi:hypothetical protein